jgi:hypothetical protein
VFLDGRTTSLHKVQGELASKTASVVQELNSGDAGGKLVACAHPTEMKETPATAW